MNKKNILLVVGIAFLGAVTIATVFFITRPEFRALIFPKAALPTITFLGEYPGTYNVAAGEYMILKTKTSDGRWNFVEYEGPRQEVLDLRSERVWKCVGNCLNFLLHYPQEVIDFNWVKKGDKVTYVGIDDDVDERINCFYLDRVATDNVCADDPNRIHVVSQGMVFYNEFTVPRDGHLYLKANDSIDAHIEVPAPPLVSPSPTSELTPTEVLTETPILTPPPSETPTLAPTNTTAPSPTTTVTSTPTHTPTPLLSCDSSCSSDADCQSGLKCWEVSSGNKRCRNSNCTGEADCACNRSCWEICGTDSECPSGLSCRQIDQYKRCVDSDCPTDSDCNCLGPTATPKPTIAPTTVTTTPEAVKLPQVGFGLPLIISALSGVLLFLIGLIL